MSEDSNDSSEEGDSSDSTDNSDSDGEDDEPKVRPSVADRLQMDSSTLENKEAEVAKVIGYLDSSPIKPQLDPSTVSKEREVKSLNKSKGNRLSL